MKIPTNLDETRKENTKRQRGETRKKELKGETVWGDERRRRKKRESQERGGPGGQGENWAILE